MKINMKHFGAALGMLALFVVSVEAMAINKASIYGADALQIVEVLESIGLTGTPGGSDDQGYVRIKTYDHVGMECVTAWSAYGGYGSKLEGACHFDKVKSLKDFSRIKSNLKRNGLSLENQIFKL